MKVALLTNFIPPYRKSLYSALNDNLSELTIFISQEMEKNRDWKVDHGDLNVVVQKAIRYSKKWRSEHSKNYKSIVQIPYDTFFKLRKNNPDIVISVEMGIRSLLASLYCLIYKKPLLIWLALSEHSEKDKKGLRILLRKFILKRASGVFCNGKSAERYVRSLGCDKKVFFVPCTSDFKLVTNRQKNNQNKTVLLTGQLIERKGILETAKALQLWANANNSVDINLIVAGDGPKKKVLQELSCLPNIDLRLLGAVPYNEMQKLYTQSDIYLFPTLGDEWGVVVNEALASGLPVLGSIYSQAAIELIDSENGWTFQPDNEKVFLEALTNAIDTPNEKLHLMGQSGVKKMQGYTAKIVSKNIHNALIYVSKHYK
ncbi:MAG: glycosyltransferase family 4 protein [Crocinitomicaceae bacterium]